MNMRKELLLAAALNFIYFGVEFLVALWIGSVSLFADSIHFLEETVVNLEIFFAPGWSSARRSTVGIALAAILLLPCLATIWMAWYKFSVPFPPSPIPLGLVGAGALAMNLSCAMILASQQHKGSRLIRAAFLGSRNDAFVNIAIVGAGVATALRPSVWPDLIVGLVIAVLNADVARQVYRATRAAP